jgi:DNA-binding winged helix-turn-helix (wHTH) protein/predicted ATPase
MALSWSFPPFRLDVSTGSLWRDDELVPLPPKPFAVLAALVARAGQVVTKDALFEAAWPDTAVTDGVLKGCIRQIRRALGEGAGTAAYIATVHRRGYRFRMPVTPVYGATSDAMPDGQFASIGPPTPFSISAASPSGLVGREAELAQLRERWAHACQGRRQMVFITGEAGIGKTTLVDAFVDQIITTDAVWSTRGQCIEHYGAGEAYLPLLEALGQLGRGPDGVHLVALLHQSAPTWLVHLPALVPAADYEAVQRRAGGATRERMMRELAEAVEGMTAQRPLVLVLEDLHWSDRATLDWLASVARRRAAARLLVLGTYRPAEAVIQAHPVRRVTQDLLLHGHGVELPLGFWAEPEVAAYLTQRFGAGTHPENLARRLHQRTEGNPLFLVTVVDELVRRGVVRQDPAGWELAGGVEAAMVGVPESLRQLIDGQLAQLPLEERQILEAAGVVGVEFTATAVGAGVEQAVERVEEWCTTWARLGQFVQTHGAEEWPDGTVTACYRFRHALYREILYERVPISRRMRWHQQIGRRLEAGYGPRAREVAAELAEHFVHARDMARAVQYLRHAGMNALHRHAHQEAIAHLTRGLNTLQTLPETLDRMQDELAIQSALGSALVATHGYAAPAVEQAYTRAYTLGQHVDDLPRRLPILRGLVEVYNVRKEFYKARELGEQYLAMAQRTADAGLLVDAYYVLGLTLFYLGELPAARAHFEQGLALYDPQRSRASAPLLDSGVACLAFLTLVLAMLGYPAQALHMSHASLRLAHELSHPYSLACAHYRVGLYQQFLGQAQAAQEQAEETIALALEKGFAFFVAVGLALKGRALSMQGYGPEGLAFIRQGLAALQATGATPGAHWLVLQAEACRQIGQTAEAIQMLGEALAFMHTTGEQNYAAELYRLKGEFLLSLSADNQSVAETSFHQSLAIARRQHAKLLELRAAVSLTRLWQQQGKRIEAYELLAPIYSWFTKGFDTADLQEPKDLLQALEGGHTHQPLVPKTSIL